MPLSFEFTVNVEPAIVTLLYPYIPFKSEFILTVLFSILIDPLSALIPFAFELIVRTVPFFMSMFPVVGLLVWFAMPPSWAEAGSVVVMFIVPPLIKRVLGF